MQTYRSERDREFKKKFPVVEEAGFSFSDLHCAGLQRARPDNPE